MARARRRARGRARPYSPDPARPRSSRLGSRSRTPRAVPPGSPPARPRSGEWLEDLGRRRSGGLAPGAQARALPHGATQQDPGRRRLRLRRVRGLRLHANVPGEEGGEGQEEEAGRGGGRRGLRSHQSRPGAAGSARGRARGLLLLLPAVRKQTRGGKGTRAPARVRQAALGGVRRAAGQEQMWTWKREGDDEDDEEARLIAGVPRKGRRSGSSSGMRTATRSGGR